MLAIFVEPLRNDNSLIVRPSLYIRGYITKHEKYGPRSDGSSVTSLVLLSCASANDPPEASLSIPHNCNLEPQGNLDDALPLQRECLALETRVLPPDHPSMASSLNNLATLLMAKVRGSLTVRFVGYNFLVSEELFSFLVDPFLTPNQSVSHRGLMSKPRQLLRSHRPYERTPWVPTTRTWLRFSTTGRNF